MLMLIMISSWVVLAIEASFDVLCIPPDPLVADGASGFFAPPIIQQLSIVLLVLLFICSLPWSIAGAGFSLLLRARRDGGQTMRCP